MGDRNERSPYCAEHPSELSPDVAAFLHGRLSISVIEGRNVDGGGPSGFFGHLEHKLTQSLDGVDPYCTIKLGDGKILQTPVIQNDANPVWNTSATFDVCHDFCEIQFRVKAEKRQGVFGIFSKVKHLGMFSLSAANIRDECSFSGWFPLGSYKAEHGETDEDASGDEEEKDRGEIRIELNYQPISELDLSDIAVPNTYFPPREGVKVTMYQDADNVPGFLPEIPFRPEYCHARCWIDISNAIMSATEFIYITGWAVWPELMMVRTEHDGEEPSSITLGEMLKERAEEGVLVCIMVWDELASGHFSSGLMGTHDEEVVNYFEDSKVHAIKVGRENLGDGPLADLNDSVLFTHHQKNIIVSRMDGEFGKNRVEAWVGGLDVTDGRYDNGSHSLFRTLNTLHAPPDFWQACASEVTAESGPREPWHDIHAHVSGLAAWDILENFENRWVCQGPEDLEGKLHTHDWEHFVQPNEEDEIRDGSFNVQVIRSINEASTHFCSERSGLIVRKNAQVDYSIHSAYVHNIRRAKHFIYIENQYFLGSSHMWLSGQRGDFAGHLIAIEVSEKICAKIRANERFAVYVNVPMYPEGPPDSAAVQEILSHQRKTVNMITTRISKTIEETGSDTCVSDWFNMFCLVNRESEEGGAGNGGCSEQEKVMSESRRFMIYLHSKFAVFDDTVAIIGSANINSRSMDGSRDTEIGIMTWQPDHVATGPTGYQECEEDAELPKGDVAAFRMSVWAEHFGKLPEEFEDPSSLDCVHMVRELANENWCHFASDEPDAVADMPHGHMAMYPYSFDEDTGGIIKDGRDFPDFPGATVVGCSTAAIPNILTG